MATESKSYIYQIIVDTQAGTASINGTAVALDKLEGKLQTVAREAQKLGKNMGQTASKTGLAGAAVVEIGRTISDSNYGIMAMANNLQQLTTLFVTLIATTGSLKNAMIELKKAFMGPLGIIVAVQIFIAMIERADQKQREAIKTAEKYAEIQKKIAKENLDDLKDSQKYISRKGELTSKEIELEEARLEREGDWRHMAGLRQEIINMNIGLLLQENEALRGLDIAKYEENLLKIRKLRAEHERILREEFGQRQDVEGVDALDPLGIAEIPTTTNDLGTSALAGLQEFYNAKNTLDAQQTAKEGQEALARRAIVWSEAEQRNEALAYIGDGIQSFGELLGEQTEAGKHVAAAGAIIQTFAAVTKALNTPGLGLARIPYAISVGAFGLAQVARIYRTRVPKKGGGGAGAGAVPSDVPIQQPDFNIVGVTRENQIQRTITDALGKPIRAYVTTKDIRSSGELDRNIVRGATVG